LVKQECLTYHEKLFFNILLRGAICSPYISYGTKQQVQGSHFAASERSSWAQFPYLVLSIFFNATY